MPRLPSSIDLSNKDAVKQTIDLEKLFGVSFDDKPALKQAIGQEIIDRIIERAEDGKDINGNALKKPYSGDYADSLAFKAYNKTKSDVNMTLTGSMLGSIDIIDDDGSEVVIGFDDRLSNNKAHGHMTGKEGKAPKMKRQFFGISNKELKDVKAEFMPDVKRQEKQSEESADVLTALSVLDGFKNRDDANAATISALFGGLFGES